MRTWTGRVTAGELLAADHPEQAQALRGLRALQQAIVQRTALHRLAAPQDIGRLIAAVTTGAGDWMTGQRIEASGGFAL